MKQIILFFLLLLPAFASGQILNIERLRLEKDTTKNVMFKTTLGLNIYNRSAAENAPVNLFGYTLDVNAMYYPDKHAYIFISKFDYLKINEDDFLNFGFLHGRINFLRARKVNFETYLQYSYDNFRGLDPRWVLGGGIRYNILKSNKVTFLLGVGLLYEFEKWQDPGSEREVEVDYVKSSNYLSLKVTINQYVDLNMINYYQVGYDKEVGVFRNRLNSSTTLNTRITEKLSFKNSFDISYEDKPIVPITKTVFTFHSGLSLDF